MPFNIYFFKNNGLFILCSTLVERDFRYYVRLFARLWVLGVWITAHILSCLKMIGFRPAPIMQAYL
ncbi:hypothetical protein DQ400_19120 [Vreelandella sulfidaeris]|uniref:Uncharacterized protein n=1 Tax=Vreelandella sulfidaeris TaxID=115553 RepID=A0A365TIY5_9GAMM|nr:hypothetical protein DQ400_19120 [Halomonas sulfidaeris]